MVKVKVKYIVQKETEIELTTREWCELHADKSELVKVLADEEGVSTDDVVIKDGYSDVVEGELDFKNLDR